MKIGIISDTHGSVQAWRQAVNCFGQVDMIIHAGDVFYHGPRNSLPDGYNPQELAEILNNLSVPLLVAQGNCDSEVDQMVLAWPMHNPFVFTKVEDKRILVQHGQNLSREQLLTIARRYQADLVITGHSHIPLLEYHDGVIVLNPGSPALPKQADQIPTAGLLEGNSIRIIRVDSGETLCSFDSGKVEA